PHRGVLAQPIGRARRIHCLPQVMTVPMRPILRCTHRAVRLNTYAAPPARHRLAPRAGKRLRPIHDYAVTALSVKRSITDCPGTGNRPGEPGFMAPDQGPPMTITARR